MRKRRWGVGSWSVGGGCHSLHSQGQLVAEIVRLHDGYRVFYKSHLLRDKPYANIGVAQLAAELRLRKEGARVYEPSVR